MKNLFNFKYHQGSRRGGFTLIELLVVISIISLLSSVVLAAVRDAKEKAEVSKFLQDVMQFRLALVLYNEKNGAIINPDSFIELYRDNPETMLQFNSIFNPLIQEGFIKKIPLPPKDITLVYTGKITDPLGIGPWEVCNSSEYSGQITVPALVEKINSLSNGSLIIKAGDEKIQKLIGNTDSILIIDYTIAGENNIKCFIL